MAQDIAKQLSNKEMMQELTNKEFLVAIYGIGEKSVESITTFFQNKYNIKLLEQLTEYGVNMDPKKYTDNSNISEAK